MCVAGTVQYVGTTNANFTNHASYPIAGVAPSGGTGVGLLILVADTGLPYAVDASGADYNITELYVPSKVV